MVNKLQSLWRRWRYKKSLKRAIKHADNMRNSRGYKCYVLFFKDGFHAITKQHVKHLLSINYFKKGVSLKDIEKRAAYITT